MKKLKNMISRTYKELCILSKLKDENVEYDMYYYETSQYMNHLIDLLYEYKNPNLNKDIVYWKLRYVDYN